jgi:hypothetical protein
MGITFNADLTANCLAWLNSEVTLKPDRLLKDARKGEKKIVSVVVALFYVAKCYCDENYFLDFFCQEPRKIGSLRKVLLEMLNIFSRKYNLKCIMFEHLRILLV